VFAKQKKTELPRLYYSHTHTHTHTHTHLRELVALASVGAMMRWYNASKKVKKKKTSTGGISTCRRHDGLVIFSQKKNGVGDMGGNLVTSVMQIQ